MQVIKNLIPIKVETRESVKLRKLLSFALLATSLIITPFGFTPEAYAIAAATVTVPATTAVAANSATTNVTGVSVGGLASGTTYLVAIGMSNFPSGATLRLPTTTGITASYGFTSGSNYNVSSSSSITLTGVSSYSGPLFIRKTDGQEVVYFQFDWS